MLKDDILTTADVAKLLGLTPAGVHWLDSKGKLRSIRTVSGQRLFFRKAVLRLVAERDAARDAAAAGASGEDAA